MRRKISLYEWCINASDANRVAAEKVFLTWAGKDADGSMLSIRDKSKYTVDKVQWLCKNGHLTTCGIVNHIKMGVSCAKCYKLSRNRYAAMELNLNNDIDTTVQLECEYGHKYFKNEFGVCPYCRIDTLEKEVMSQKIESINKAFNIDANIDTTLEEVCKQLGEYGEQIIEQFTGLSEDLGSDRIIVDDENRATIKASDIIISTPVKYLFKCKNNHIYIDSIINRIENGCTCDICKAYIQKDNRVTLGEWCSLKGEYGAEILSEWTGITDEGYTVDINDILPGSKLYLTWRCKNGHSFRARPFDRTRIAYRKNGMHLVNYHCPYCKGKMVSDDNSLLNYINKHNSVECYYVKEYYTGIDSVTHQEFDVSELAINSTRTLIWKCKHGHEIKAKISDMLKYDKEPCYICNRTLRSYFDSDDDRAKMLESQWTGLDEHGNKIDSQAVSKSSTIKAKWRCSCGCEWNYSIIGRVLRLRGDCPNCKIKSHRETKTIQDWLNENSSRASIINLEWTGFDVNSRELRCKDRTRCNSYSVLKWRCTNGHEWIDTVRGRLIDGRNCPCCAARKTI